MSNAAEKLEVPQPYATELVELDRVEAALSELRAKHGTVPDYSTKEGYERGKASLKELTKYRAGTDKARLAITKPHRDFIDQVNRYAKGLIGEIEQIEAPHRDAKQAVDEAEARAKEERVARLRERLEKEVTSYLDTAAGLDSNALADLITAAEGIDTEGYFDLSKEAEDEKARVIRELRDLHHRTLEREQLAAERAEIERQKAQLARMQSAVPGPIPTDEIADVSELLEAHGEASSHWDEAFEDLMTFGIEIGDAQALLAEIAAGGIRHVAFNHGGA